MRFPDAEEVQVGPFKIINRAVIRSSCGCRFQYAERTAVGGVIGDAPVEFPPKSLIGALDADPRFNHHSARPANRACAASRICASGKPHTADAARFEHAVEIPRIGLKLAGALPIVKHVVVAQAIAQVSVDIEPGFEIVVIVLGSQQRDAICRSARPWKMSSVSNAMCCTRNQSLRKRDDSVADSARRSAPGETRHLLSRRPGMDDTAGIENVLHRRFSTPSNEV